MEQNLRRRWLFMLLAFPLVLNACGGGTGGPLPDPDTTSPAVSIVAPVDGATFATGEVVEVSGVATDDGGVAGVELLVDGVVVGQATLGAGDGWVYAWTPAEPGAYELSASAKDEAGNGAISAVVAVTIGEEQTWPLADSDYLLELSGQLQSYEFDPDAGFWVQVVTAIEPYRKWSWEWHRPSYPATPEGNYSISVDAREIEGDGVDAELFGSWHLTPGKNETMKEVSVSDDGVRLQVLEDILLRQVDPASNHLASDALNFWVIHEMEGVEVHLAARPVFSHGNVDVSGSVGVPGSAPRVELDLRLKAGWNLVYSQPFSFGSKTSKLIGRPLTEDDQPELNWLSERLVQVPVSVFDGYSIFALHQLQDPGSASRSLSFGTSGNIFARSWLNSSHATRSQLVSFEEVFPGTMVHGSPEVSDPGARGLMAGTLYYDESATAPSGWWNDPDLSTGSLVPVSENGEPMLLIYSDRSVSMDAAMEVVDSDPKLTIRAVDLELSFGWNFIEVRPSSKEPGILELIRRDEVPDRWELQEH